MEWMGIPEEIFYGKSIAIVPMDLYYPGKGKGGDLPPRSFMRRYHDEIVALLPKIELRILIGKYAISHYDKKGAKLPLMETALLLFYRGRSVLLGKRLLPYRFSTGTSQPFKLWMD